MAREACNKALEDCQLDYKDNIDVVVASYCYGEPTSGEIVPRYTEKSCFNKPY